MMQLNHGIFDEASVSVIASETVREIGRLTGRNPDVRRFRPNVVDRLPRPVPFQEDESRHPGKSLDVRAASSFDMSVVHIFRFEHDRIVELWDIGQAVPAAMVNRNGMF